MTQRAITRAGLREKGILISNTQLWRMIKDGRFPQPFTAGTRERVWLESELDAWLLERAAERRGDAA